MRRHRRSTSRRSSSNPTRADRAAAPAVRRRASDLQGGTRERYGGHTATPSSHRCCSQRRRCWPARRARTTRRSARRSPHRARRRASLRASAATAARAKATRRPASAPRGHPCRLSVRAACRVRGRQPPEPGHAATLDTADAARARRGLRVLREPARAGQHRGLQRHVDRPGEHRRVARDARTLVAGPARVRAMPRPRRPGWHRVSAARGPAGRLYRRPAERLETRHAPARATSADAGDRRQAV